MKKKFILCGTLRLVHGNFVYRTSLLFLQRLYTCRKNLHLDVSNLWNGMYFLPALPEIKDKKYPSARQYLHCFYFCRGIFIRSVFKETPDLSLGLQSCKIQYQRGHPSWLCAALVYRRPVLWKIFEKILISFRFKCHALSNETNGIVNITPIVEAIPWINSIPMEYILMICVVE